MKSKEHSWEFKPRFRKNAFGWKSQPAITRIKEAVAEIRRVAKKDDALGAEGAVLLLERLSPALERIDSSSGAIGNAVWEAINTLVPIIAQAVVEPATREAWLERLWQAIQDDDMPYIEALGDFWGPLCAEPAMASRWADEFLPITREVLAPDTAPGAFFKGTSLCLSALLFAGRHDELIALIEHSKGKIYWDCRVYAVRAMAAMGRIDDAIAYAESSRGLNVGDYHVARICEGILLVAGDSEQAYRNYAFEANRAATYLATWRALCKKYPSIDPRRILNDCIEHTPGEEGKWFASARTAGYLDLALRLATEYRTEPKTLINAARDHAMKDPDFAIGVGLLALRGIDAGYGYDLPNSADVLAAYDAVMRAAEASGKSGEVRASIRAFHARPGTQSFVWSVLGRRIGIT